MFAVIVADLAESCGDDPSGFCERVYELTNSDGATMFIDWLAGPPLRILLIVFGGWFLARMARRWVNRYVDGFIEDHLSAEERAEKRTGMFSPVEERALERMREFQSRSERSRQRAVTMGSVLSSTLTVFIWATVVLLVLSELDVNLGPLIAGAGIAGVALGFGAQTLVRDFLSGIFIVFEDQYGVGDFVDLGEASGTVEKVSLRTTRVRDIEGSLWVVPNGEITRVSNSSQLWARSVLDVEVGYDTDLDEAMAVISATAHELWREEAEATTILEEPEVWGIQSLGDSAISIRLAVKTEPAEQWATARELRRRLKTALDEAGIEIPFPQRVVHLHPATDAASSK
ncbi:MAG: mechanosensitive ion channel family protein [Acidimicrobiales bacterium]